MKEIKELIELSGKLSYLRKSLSHLKFYTRKDVKYIDRSNKTEILLNEGFDKNIYIDEFYNIINIHCNEDEFKDVKKFKNEMNDYIQFCINELYFEINVSWLKGWD